MSTLFAYPAASPVAAGESYASSTLNFYQPGTTTAITTYTTAALSVAHPATITADANGVFAPIFVNEAVNATYRMIHKTAAGVTIRDVDNLPTGLSATAIGLAFYPRSAAEISANITPVSYNYPPLHVARYVTNTSPGTTDCVTGINNATLVAATGGGGTVTLAAENYRISSSVILRDGVSIAGAGVGATTISYYGSAEGIASITPSTRIYACSLSGFTLIDQGTGTIGVDLSAVSTTALSDMQVDSFDTGVRCHSPTAGYAVYNRLYNVTANQCTTGFKVSGTSSNANVYDACRMNGASTSGTIGWDIADSNGNTIINCHTDVAGIHIKLTASSPGLADGNVCWSNRIEGVTTGHDVGANCRHTHIGANYYSSVTNRITDAGTDTIIYDPYWNTPGIKARFQTASAAGGHIHYTREADGGSSLPFMLLTDENTGSGTPVTLQIAKERNAGQFLTNVRGAVVLSSFENAGGLMLTGAAPTVGAGQVGYGATTSATVGAAGGATALPATPTGYLIVNIAGTAFKVPYYAT